MRVHHKSARVCQVISALLAAGWLLFPAPLSAKNKTVYGYLENVLIYPGPFAMEAKLDTGADHSSAHAIILKQEKRGGKDWITFEISNRSGASVVLEKPLRRIAKVRRHTGPLQRRPVVLMEICLGKVRREVPVNLVDRENLSYKILIGRSFLRHSALVDASAKFTSSPECK